MTGEQGPKLCLSEYIGGSLRGFGQAITPCSCLGVWAAGRSKAGDSQDYPGLGSPLLCLQFQLGIPSPQCLCQRDRHRRHTVGQFSLSVGTRICVDELRWAGLAGWGSSHASTVTFRPLGRKLCWASVT